MALSSSSISLSSFFIMMSGITVKCSWPISALHSYFLFTSILYPSSLTAFMK